MTPQPNSPRPNAFLFDLDGTLIDSVYQHVLAWHRALQAERIELSVWRIHRKIGMSGGLFADQLLREIARDVSPAMIGAWANGTPRSTWLCLRVWCRCRGHERCSTF